MPPLPTAGRVSSPFEFWPAPLFYLPVALRCLWLAFRHGSFTLPTLANPGLPVGGLAGESKSAVMASAGSPARELIAPFVVLRRPDPYEPLEAAVQRALGLAAGAGLYFPFVAKPDLGCRGAGVQLVADAARLRDYLARFPNGADVILQRLVPEQGEAGVFYVRMPGEARGRIFSLTLKYFPQVVGDGRANLRELILRNPRARRIASVYLKRHVGELHRVLPAGTPFRLAFAGNHCRGAVFRDGRHLVTPAMTRAFDAIAGAIPEYYFGRLDVRFADIADLQRGEKFSIVDINGGGSEATHIWDKDADLWQAYRTLFAQYDLLFAIGRANWARGFRPTVTLLGGLARMIHEWRLTLRYPTTH